MRTLPAKRIFIVVVLLTCLMSCKKSDPDPAVQAARTTYLIMGNDAGVAGSIATYVFETSTLNANAYPSASIADMAIDNGKLYASTKVTKTIDFLDSKTFSIAKSPSFGKDTKNFGNYIYKHIAVAAGKIFISDLVNVAGTNKCFLKAMSISDPSKVDSIGLAPDEAVVSIQTVNNKLFISTLGQYYNGHEIIVIDATNYSILSRFGITTPCSQLMVDADNNIMGVQTGSLLRINATNYTITNTPFPGTPLIVSTVGSLAVSSAVLNKDANLIYSLAQAAQPAIAPYVLTAFDLSSKTSKIMTTAFINASTIAFDKTNKVLLVGSVNANASGVPDPGPDKGVITFYNENGAVVRKVTMPKIPEKILVLE